MSYSYLLYKQSKIDNSVFLLKAHFIVFMPTTEDLKTQQIESAIADSKFSVCVPLCFSSSKARFCNLKPAVSISKNKKNIALKLL